MLLSRVIYNIPYDGHSSSFSFTIIIKKRLNVKKKKTPLAKICRKEEEMIVSQAA